MRIGNKGTNIYRRIWTFKIDVRFSILFNTNTFFVAQSCLEINSDMMMNDATY